MFAEIRNNYIFEEPENGIKEGITIDAWKTFDNDEEGVVVATVILTEHDDIVVVWNENAARRDEKIRIAIEEAKAKLIQL